MRDKLIWPVTAIICSVICLIACIVLSLGVWFVCKSFRPERAWVQSGVKEIRAKRFILEDENGKTRADLSVGKNNPGLWLFDENGKVRASLNIGKDGSGLGLSDENSKTRIVLYMGKDGPRLALFGENGKLIWKAP